MIVVDTSVWVDWFNGIPGPHPDRLDRAFAGNEGVVTAPVVIAEVLQGFRHDADFDQARSILMSLRMLTLDGEGHADAARLYRLLRRKGVTVRGIADCIIAQTCLAHGTALLSPDRDFTAIAKHCGLKLCAV